MGPLSIGRKIFITAVATCALAYSAYKVDTWYDQRCLQESIEKDEVTWGNNKYEDSNFPGTDADLENNPDWSETHIQTKKKMVIGNSLTEKQARN